MNQRNEFSRRKLPHWYPDNASYFVTIRLAGSLPQEMVTELIARRRNAIASLKKAVSLDQYKNEQEKVEKRIIQIALRILGLFFP
jgi:hypothetical protein